MSANDCAEHIEQCFLALTQNFNEVGCRIVFLLDKSCSGFVVAVCGFRALVVVVQGRERFLDLQFGEVVEQGDGDFVAVNIDIEVGHHLLRECFGDRAGHNASRLRVKRADFVDGSSHLFLR